ncbi:MAG: LytTR family transcriptional regulator [Firmicutes bacterium]|nr:LytTR family transcriptional regulator [Bacillota bacterium]
MLIEIKIDEDCAEPKVLIITNRITDEINEFVRKVSEQDVSVLAGFKDDSVFVLDPDNILRIYAADQKVYAISEDGEYRLRLRLYEVEERLRSQKFVRISNSEIINLKKVRDFDLGFSGTICVRFQNKTQSYVSRRYVPKIKQVLGL